MRDDQSGFRPDRLIEWTGERCVPWTGDLQVVYEHYHRYLLARPLVEGKRVLDLASGEGYGAALLAERATQVIGVEIDPASVEHSRQTYSEAGLEFVEGSMLDLSAFPHGSFDVVTCFEALEHVAEHDELIAGVKRVLTPDGIFLTSTPDRLRYTEELHQHNPHHVRELSQAEFSELLCGAFRYVRIWGQAIVVGSLIEAVGASRGGGAEVLPLAQQGENWVQQDSYPPTYFIAAASARELPTMPAQSVLVDIDITLVRSAQRELYERSSELETRSSELETRSSELESTRAELSTRLTQLESISAEQRRLAVHLAELDERDARVREQLHTLGAERDAALASSQSLADQLAVLEQELGAIHRSRSHRLAFAAQRVRRGNRS